MGTLMVPISLCSEQYNDNSENTQRVESPSYSDDIRLVNFTVIKTKENKQQLFVDDLAKTTCYENNFENSAVMFSEMMDDDVLFNSVTNTLIEQFQEKTN